MKRTNAYFAKSGVQQGCKIHILRMELVLFAIIQLPAIYPPGRCTYILLKAQGIQEKLELVCSCYIKLPSNDVDLYKTCELTTLRVDLGTS